MHVRETNGERDSLNIDSSLIASATGAIMAEEVNALEEPVKLLWSPNREKDRQGTPAWLIFKPYETKFLKLTLWRD